MPTIIDRLVLEFGLDPAAYNKGAKGVRDTNKKIRDEVGTQTRDMDAYTKQAGAFFGKLRTEVVGLGLAFAGANSLKGFVEDILTGDAATGRFANSIGMATQDVSAWELALKSVGGTAEDARQAIGGIADAYQKARLQGTTGRDKEFARLGLTGIDDFQSPEAALLKIADAKRVMGLDNATYTSRLKDIGMSDSMIALLQKGPDALRALLDEKRRDAAASGENAKAAADLEAKLADLSARIKSEARPSVYSLVDAFEKADDALGLVNLAVPVATGLIGALGIAAIAAAPELMAVAGAIAAIAAAYQNWDKIKAEVGDWFTVHRSGGGAGDDTHATPGGDPNIRFGPKRDERPWYKRAWDAVTGIDFGVHSGGGAQGRPSPGPGMPGGAVGGGAGGRVSTGRLDPEIYQALAAKYGAARAAGIAAGIAAEGGSLGMAANGAFGIGQWRGARQRELFRRYGRAPTKQQQLAFLMWELEGGDRGGRSVLAQSTPEDALSYYIGGTDWGFMRPGPGRAGDMQRGMQALGITRAASRVTSRGSVASRSAPVVASVGTINVYTAATDAKGIASELPGAIASRTLVTQANRGLE